MTDKDVREDRMLHRNWDLYDTRHTVFRPARLSPKELEQGYWRAYESFYRWSAILRGAAAKPSWLSRLRHIAYAGGWKKMEPFWDLVIRAKRAGAMLPVLETVLDPALRTPAASPHPAGGQAVPLRPSPAPRADRWSGIAGNETERGTLPQVERPA